MPIIIRRNNRPSGWEQLGRGIQDSVSQYQQGNVALSREQNVITREMLNLALQDRRMRDASARDERRTQMTLDLERRRAEQDDKWRRGLRQQESGLRQSAGSGSRWQAANMKDRTDTPVRFNAYAGETVPSGEWGGENRSVASGTGNSQLSATLNSMGISTATPAQAAHPDMLMRQLNQFRQSAAQPVDLYTLVKNEADRRRLRVKTGAVATVGLEDRLPPSSLSIVRKGADSRGENETGTRPPLSSFYGGSDGF